MKEVETTFGKLEAFISAYDPVSLLSQLTATFLFTPGDEFQGEASDTVKWERWIEFLAGYLIVRPYPQGRSAMVDGSVLESLEKLLEQYFNAVARHLFAEAGATRDNPAEAEILAHAKIESLYVRGEAYPHQFYTFAKGLYGPHDGWFRDHYGFTIAEAIEISRAVDRLSNERFNESLQQARKEARAHADRSVASQEITEAERDDVVARIFCSLHFGRSQDLLAFTSEDLSKSTGISIQICRAFVTRMSQEFGYRNDRFPDSFTNPVSAPWDYNTLLERPIVGRARKHWLFVPRLLTTALFTTFHFDLLRDKAYLPTYEKARGKFLEGQTAECLRRVFLPTTVMLNPQYPDGTEMADVMVLHDHKVLLFQCKSRALTYPARIGADFNAIRSDVRKAIADAFRQGTKARDYLQANKEAEFVHGEEHFAIEMNRVNGLYVVSVTSMPLQSLAGRFANTNSALGLFSGNEYPWSLSLGDLDILTQILGSPAQFLHYLLRRREVERTPFEIHADELDYLGFYLSQGMYFDTGEFKEIDGLGLSGMSSEIDRWVFERFELERDIEPPHAPMPNGFSDFLRDVERAANDYGTDCAMSLLDLGAKGRARFMELVEHTKARSRQDNGPHSFSAVLKDGECGHSFLCYNANGDRIQVFEQTAAFAMLKKYQSKCRDWAGFGWDLTSPRMVDVAFFISQPWVFDEHVERLAKSKLLPGQRVDT